METIQVPVTIYKAKYVAFDGKKFDDKGECELYEKKLKFKAFQYDESKAKGKLRHNNWQHYMYRFLSEFKDFPEYDYQLLEESGHRKRDYSNKDIGFQLKSFRVRDVKKYFVDALFGCSTYINHWMFYSSDRRTDEVITTKHTELMEKTFKFFFESGLISFDDLVIKSGDYSRYGDERNEEEKLIEKISYVNKHIFHSCFAHNSIKSLKIAIKYLNLDLNDILKCNIRRGYSTNSTLRYHCDFITLLALDDQYTTNHLNDEEINSWIKFFIQDLDVEVSLERAPTSYVKQVGGGTSMRNHDSPDNKIMKFSIEDTIDEIKNTKNSHKHFIFDKHCDELVEIFENAGPKFKKLNEKTERNLVYDLVKSSIDIVKEIFKENDKYKVIYDDFQKFDVKRFIFYEDYKWSNKNYDTEYESIYANFWLECFNRESLKGFDVIEFVRSTERRSKKGDDIIKIKSLSEYDSPEALATDIIYTLTEGELVTADGRINTINLELQEIQKQKEALSKKEEELLSTKAKRKKVSFFKRKKDSDSM